MKLPIVIAVLVLVLAAQSEAQEESTVADKFTKFQNQMKELGESLLEKTKDTFQAIHNSEFSTSARSWFSEQYQKIKEKFD